jgi:ubiquinone/menaquinone biosynthesis C-methylase UbiE
VNIRRTMSDIEWDDQTCQEYARYMETVVPHDHRRFAARIARDWPEVPAGATVVDIAGGPAFLSLELAPYLTEPRLVVADMAPRMIEIGHQRAAARGRTVEGHLCPAEALDLGDASADLVLCKHFVRLATDLDACLREMVRILKPGGRAYVIDFSADRPWFGAMLLRTWIQLTAPPFLRRNFRASMALGLPPANLLPRLTAAGFQGANVLRSSVSYLVRAVRH